MTIPLDVAIALILLAYLTGCAWRDVAWKMWVAGYLRVTWDDVATVNPDAWLRAGDGE